MPQLDLNNGFLTVENKIKAAKAFSDLNTQYKNAKKKVGKSLEEKKSSVVKTLDSATKKIDDVKQKANSYQKKIKTQFDQLLDLSKLTSNSKSSQYIKRKLLETIRTIEPQITTILLEDTLKAVGCDQNQTYVGNQRVYIKLNSIDFLGILKLDPNDDTSKPLYEKTDSSNPQEIPYSMNRQLYKRTQSTNDYKTDYNDDYKGSSGQGLFNIKYLDNHPTTNESGGWYEITLSSRTNNVNSVKEFITDYYTSIKLFENQNVMAGIIEALTGAISINIGNGDYVIDDTSKLFIYIQRILGLCFDKRSEIDVAGTSKISELDGGDQSFYELDEVDLRDINLRRNNIKRGVVQFESCDNVDLPVNYQGLLNDLNTITLIKDEDFVNKADKLTNNIVDDEEKQKFGFDIAIDDDVIKSVIKGLTLSIFSPKVILPILTMYEVLYQNATQAINSFTSFMKNFKSYVKSVISKIGALFVETLFGIIKKDIIRLIKSISREILIERVRLKYKRITKLIDLLLIVAKFVSDWRQCKSVIDELFMLLNLARGKGVGSGVPLPLLFGSQLLEGSSPTRAFINTIEDLQSLGIPTGPMPDGSPNLTMLSMFSSIKGSADEIAENGKIEIAIPPLTITPAGITIPLKASGKSI
jgi:hypothetical protein